MTDRPPRGIDRLLERAVDSVGSVELLLLLRSAGNRPRTVTELCAALNSPSSWTSSRLDALRLTGLVRRDEHGGWRYAPSDPRLASAVDDLAAEWQRDSSSVRRWVFAPRHRERRRRTA
jgi:DNA-binding IclR family transcriptional regulator